MQTQNITYRFIALGASLVLTGLVVIAPHIAPAASHQRLIDASYAGAGDEGKLAAVGVAAVLRIS